MSRVSTETQTVGTKRIVLRLPSQKPQPEKIQGVPSIQESSSDSKSNSSSESETKSLGILQPIKGVPIIPTSQETDSKSIQNPQTTQSTQIQPSPTPKKLSVQEQLALRKNKSGNVRIADLPTQTNRT